MKAERRTIRRRMGRIVEFPWPMVPRSKRKYMQQKRCTRFARVIRSVRLRNNFTPTVTITERLAFPSKQKIELNNNILRVRASIM